jgi:cytochrome c oxidase subunit 2
MKRALLFAALLALALPALALAGSTAAPSIWLPEVVSEGGRLIDRLYWVILIIVIVIFVVTEGLLLYSVIAFRARPGRKAQFFHGSTSVELILAAIPALILVWITVASSRLWTDLKLQRSAAEDAVHVQVLAEQFAWNFRYAGPDAAFGTADDVMAFNEMVVPVGREVVFHLSAKDVIHSFFLPESRLKQDTVPGLLTRAWTQWERIPAWDLEHQKRVLLTPEQFAKADVAVSGYKFSSKPAAKKAGWYQASDSEKIGYLEYSYQRDAGSPLQVLRDGKPVKAEASHVLHYFEISCAQLCGTSHFAMRGTVKVLPDAQFRAWLGEQAYDSFLAEKWTGYWDQNYPEFNRAL